MSESPFREVPSGLDIAHYFAEETERQNNGCDGINLYRDGEAYCYLWVEAMIDHDMWVSYLLDIRTKPGVEKFDETRDFLFVHFGAGAAFEVEWHNKPVRFDADYSAHRDRSYDGLHWFVNRDEAATERRDGPGLPAPLAEPSAPEPVQTQETLAGLAPALLLAHIIDPPAFEDHPIERRREAAALQWAARRHIALEHATRVLAAGWVSPADHARALTEAWDQGWASGTMYGYDEQRYPNPFRKGDADD